VDSSIAKGFFAYPFQPAALAEVMRTAAERINQQAGLKLTVWESLRTGGKIIIDEICRTIDEADFLLADLTGVNPNVMFELGFAVARNKRIWVILESTRPAVKREYDQVRLLTGIGFCSYANSQHIVNGFFHDRPFDDLISTVWTNHIQPLLKPGDPSSLVYLKARHETEAARRVNETVSRYQKKGLPFTLDDPTETRVQSLAWYGQKLYSAIAVLVHFSSEDREGARIHNARQAFVSGLAHGLDKPLLMLAEQDYTAPLDYKDLLVNYATAAEAVTVGASFFDQVLIDYRPSENRKSERLSVVRLATELKNLRLGEYLAENEVEQLKDYFVDTSAYRLALEGRSTIFVGRKGTGKTANLIRVASVVGKDRRNLVVVIQPLDYDLAGLTRLLRKYTEVDTKGYLIESLWKFLIYSELAHAAAQDIEQRPGGGPYTVPETQLLELYRSPGSLLRDDFSIRLERALESLQPLPEHPGIEETRVAISEALHNSMLTQLRRLLGDILGSKDRVAVLVDNLDKRWVRDQDLDHLSQLILALFSVANRIPNEFARSASGRHAVNLSLAVFLRSDIFYYLIKHAREPDKISFSRILWSDRISLLRVLDERFTASQDSPVEAEELWRRFFVPKVNEMPMRDYLISRILPRPRDLLYLTTAAIDIAINRGHGRVEDTDVLEAEKQYSRYALDTIEAEATAALAAPKELLYEFIGATEILERDTIEQFMLNVGLFPEQFQNAIDYLTGFGFLGLEVRPGQFNFAADENELERNLVLSRKVQESEERGARYKVNIPFHSFLRLRNVRKREKLRHGSFHRRLEPT
jgi:hypothetical protein